MMDRDRKYADRVEGIKAFAKSTLRIVAKTLPSAISKRDAVLAHENVRAAASGCLRAAMVLSRHDKDYIAAKHYCDQCASYTDTLAEMEGLGLAGTPWSGFYVLYCSLMAGRLTQAEAVALWMTRCPTGQEFAADPHDPIALLSGYAVLDLRAKFETYRRESFDTSWHATHPFFGPLSVYLDLWHAILARDQVRLDAEMLRREDHHVRLSKQRGEGRLEFGGGEDSAFIVDFMGIGCAIMARRRGMWCDLDTKYLPRGMVDIGAV